MLETFRKLSNSSATYLVFGALIVVFAVSFGPGANGCAGKGGTLPGETAEFAARVDGQAISVVDFQRDYSRTLDEYQQRGLDSKMAEQMGLKRMVFDRLVNTELLAQAAQKRGLYVGDRELAETIHRISSFQKDGVFSTEQYKLIVERQINTSIPAFEKQLRHDLVAQKMALLIQDAATLSDVELRGAYDQQSDRASLQYVRFAPAMFTAEAKSEPTAKEIEAAVASKGTEIEAFFKANTFRFNKPQRMQARHILVKLEDGASEAKQAEAKAKIDRAVAELKAGKAFAEVAKAHSEDLATKDRGGELGLLTAGSLDKALEEASSKLKEGQATDPVRTHFGYQVVQVDKVLPAESKTLDQVKSEIANELLKSDASKRVAKARAEEAIKAIAAGKAMTDLFAVSDNQFAFGAATKPATEKTGPFSVRGDFIPRIGPSPEVMAVVAKLTKEAPVAQTPVEVNGSFFVVQLETRESPNDADFATKKDALREQVLGARRQGLLGGYLKDLKATAKVEENQALLGPSGPAGAIPLDG